MRHRHSHGRHRTRLRPWGWPGWAYGWRYEPPRFYGYRVCRIFEHRYWEPHVHDRWGATLFFGVRTPGFGYAFWF